MMCLLLMQVRPGMFIFDTLDWLHVGWRIRAFYLNPNKCLLLGGLLISHSVLTKYAMELGLIEADLDPSNKQSYSGGD